MLGLTALLLFEGQNFASYIWTYGLQHLTDRGNQKTIFTLVFHSFYRKGGVDSIARLCRYFMGSEDAISEVKTDDRTEAQTQELLHAQGGLKVVLHVLHPMIMAKPLLESSQTILLNTPDKKDTDPDYFESHNFVIRLRATVLPLLRDLWQAPWLVSVPLSVTKSVVQIVLELLNADGEVKDPAVEGTNGPLPSLAHLPLPNRTVVGPDEGRIQQLLDMGFPRSAAERALTRTRNNVNAAAELLLAQPFPFVPDPVQPNEPAPEPAPAPEPVPAPDTNATPALEEATNENLEESTQDDEAPNEPATESVSEPEPEPPVVGKSTDEWLKELNAAREPLKEGIGRRALTLVDQHPSLVFDIQRLFVGPSSGYRAQSVQFLLDDIHSFASAAYDHQEHPLAVRFRLFALLLSEPTASHTLSRQHADQLMKELVSLLLSKPGGASDWSSNIPKWLAAHLLVAEALLMMGEEPRSIALPKEGEEVKKSETLDGGQLYLDERDKLLDLSLALISTPTLGRDELLSALRLLILLTRDSKYATAFSQRNGVEVLFRCVKAATAASNANGIHSYVAMIVRHVVEDSSIIRHIMKQEVKRYFANPRNRVVDVQNYVRNCGSMALRDPRSFIQVTEETCQLMQPYGINRTITLREPGKQSDAPTTSAPQDTTGEMQIDGAQPGVTDTLESTVHFMISELMRTVRSEHGSEPGTTMDAPQDRKSDPPLPNPHPPADRSEDGQASVARFDDEGRIWLDNTAKNVDFVYSCFIMQCLTELLFSYDSCKLAFLSFNPKKRLHTPAKESGTRHRSAALHFLLSELINFGTINPQVSPDGKRQIMLCNWAMSVIVALCVDTFPTQDLKDVPPDRVSVRKFVLDAISRALKDTPQSDNLDSRYGRLLALADLCHRLLSVRFNIGPRRNNEDAPTHLAKIMLEKNFVATLTNVLAEVDLNYPHIKAAVAGILRPLEYL